MSIQCLASMDQDEAEAAAERWGAIQPNAHAHSTNVNFIIRARLEQDQEIRLSGDAPQLGSWDPSNALSLIRDSSSSTLYTCSVQLTTGVGVQYRYVIASKDGVHDEPNKSTRTVLPKGVDMWVDDEWMGVEQQLGERRVRINRGIKRQQKPSMDEVSALAAVSEDASAAIDKVIVCVFRLPIKSSRREDGSLCFEKDSDALYRTYNGLVDALKNRVQLIFVGVLWGVDIDEDEEDEVEETLLRDFNCIPVFIPEKTLVAMYWGYCKGVLWPLFHSVMDLMSGKQMKQYDERLWRAYCSVNRKFAEAVVQSYDEEGSTAVWIHDYHLLVLPGYIRRKLSGCNIGFFLHTPFPTSEVFRILPHREDILKGLLCSSLIGFHMFDYTRHFLSSCVRILGLEHQQVTGGFLAVEYGGRTVTVRVSHIGVTAAEWRRDGDQSPLRVKEGSVAPEIKELLETFSETTVMCSVMNDYDRLKGAPLLLLAFERLLMECTQWQGQVQLLLICPKPPRRTYNLSSPSTTESQEYPIEISILQAVEDMWDVYQEIVDHVHRINERFDISDGPITFIEKDLNIMERRMVYGLSDIMLVTPIRDGLNLVPYEYIATEPNEGRSHPGAVMVVSEFTGCSRALCGGIRINPWNVDEYIRALDKALSTPDRDREHMRAQDLKYVTTHTTGQWAKSFLNDLETCYEPKEKMTALGLGFGMSFNTLEPSGQNTNHLEYEDMSEAYKTASGRLFLLDCEGTIKVDGTRPPTAGMLQALTALAADPRNIIIVMSGRSREQLAGWFGSIPNISLAAENGFYYKVPQLGEEWVCLDPTVDLSWVGIVEGVMQEYCERTDGAQYSATESHLRWGFRDTDHEFGSWQARQLKEDLEQVITPGLIEVNVTAKACVVHPKSVNRGVLVATLAGLLPQLDHAVDMITCFGDGRADEDSFAAIAAHIPENIRMSLYTCTVGRKNSHADYFVDGMENVELILTKLGEVSTHMSQDAQAGRACI